MHIVCKASATNLPVAGDNQKQFFGGYGIDKKALIVCIKIAAMQQ
jgi:hypothetical protein